MPAEIILVAGLGRCGTSLALQMLAAGGVPCVGERPSFEDERHHALLGSDPRAWAAQAEGRAVKLLDPHRSPPPEDQRYRTFWLFRDWADQACSQLKMSGAAQHRANRRRLERALKAETTAANSALWRAGAADALLVVPFDCLLLRPRDMARLMAQHVDRDLDIDAVASVAVARDVTCFPGFLEATLVA